MSWIPGVDALHETVKSWFGGFWSRMGEAFSKNLGWTVTFWTSAVAVFGWIWKLWDAISGGLATTSQFLDSWAAPHLGLPPGVIVEKMTLANTFFPLEESFARVVAFISLLSLLASLRLMRKTVGWFFGL